MGAGHGLLGFEVCESSSGKLLSHMELSCLIISRRQAQPAHQPFYVCLDQQLWSPDQGSQCLLWTQLC